MLRSVPVLAVLVFSLVPVVRADETSVPQQPLRSQPPAVFALTGAKVVLHPEKTLEQATVIVRQGVIEAVGVGIPVPADAHEINFAGRTIYPGFIDAYAELSLSSDRLNGTARYWNGQVTPQLSTADQAVSLPDTSALRQQGFVARLIAPADGVIRGRSALLTTGSGELNTTLLMRDVAQHVLLTVPRRSRGGFPGSPMGAVALARQAMLDAQWFRDAQTAMQADRSLPAIEQNDALQALQPVIQGRIPVIISTSNEQFVLRAEQFAAEFGLSLIIHGNGREYRRLAEVAATKRPLILPLSFPRPPAVGTPEATQDATLETLLHWDLAPENPARLEAAGVRFAFTADRLTSGSDFLKALRKAVQRGLSPTAALQALTITPAELFGVSSRLGTIEPGKLASLVVTDGDLFAEKTKVLETWVSGERFEATPQAVRDAAGHYELQLTQAGQFPNRLYLNVQQSDGRLRGHISRSPIPVASADTGRRDPKSTDTTTPAAAPTAGDMPTATTDTQTAANSPATSKPDLLELKSLRLSDTLLTASFPGGEWGIDGTVRLSLTLTEPNSAVRDRPAGIGTVLWIDGSVATAVVQRTEQPAAAPPATPTDPNSAQASATPPTTPPADATTAAPATVQTTPATDKPVTDNTDKPATKAAFEVNYPLGAFGRTTLPALVGRTAFVHATIWTCGPAGILEDATLIIENGSITAVGRDLPIPAETTVIDVRGMHLTPGIIDCHSHMATDGGVNEATQAITCEVRVGDFVDANDITIYRQLAGGVTAANILHGSANPIGGQNQVIKLRWGQNGEGLKFAEAPPGVKFALGENVKQSNRMDGGGRYPTTRMGVEQLFRDTFEAARDYSRRHDAWQKTRRGIPPRRDLELEALAEIVQGKRWIHCHSYRQDEILALLRVLEQYDITVGTLQHILEGYKVADELAKHGAMASAFSDWWAYKFEVYDAIPHAGALMHQQGVVVSFNSDDGELARHLNQEAAKAVKYGGVPREEALKFVTLNPAKQLRVDHLVGSLETGKQADFVIWNGDPLSNFTRCEQTWVDGRRYFSREEDEQLRQTARQKRNVLIQKILTSGEDMRGVGERDVDAAELWPRIDEYCAHFRHQAELQKARAGAEQQ